LPFFSIFAQKNIFEISGYYDWNLLRGTKKYKKRCQLLYNMIERLENTNGKKIAE